MKAMPYEDKTKSAAISIKKPHSISMEDRRKLSITGVEEVESFDEQEIVMSTNDGTLVVRGENLSISRLSVDSGDVNVQGQITALQYEEKVSAGGLWSKLFH